MSGMARLAWFTPLPPTPSGIAAYNAELLPLVAAHHEIDAFVEPASSTDMRQAAGLTVRPAHDFAWRHRQTPYDLVVYQLGNAACHDFIWPHLPRYPGLVVLHDGQLHHARARRLLAAGRLDDYRAEFRYNHPDAPPGVAELVIAALAGSMYYVYPMLRWVLRSSRLVAVHSPGLAHDLREAYPGVEVHTIRPGTGDPWEDGGNAKCKMQNAECEGTEYADGGPSQPDTVADRLPPAVSRLTGASRRLRERYRIPGDAVVFGAFGLVTPEKRIGAALRALAGLAADHPEAHLLLAGGTVPHYDAMADARALGIEERVHLTGYVADEELPAHVQAADVCLCLRWPTGGETSAIWLRAIAAGKPTIVTDLAHAGQAPALEPQGWSVLPPTLAGPSTPLGLRSERPEHRRRTPPEPLSVSIDILDEDRLLALAMRRIAADGAHRAALGRAERQNWALNHTIACAVDDYRRVIRRALERPVERPADLPAHLLPDPLAGARRLVAQVGVNRDLLT
jgi:glycosyltransferase involved in cell wall biosynthesis